MLDSFIDTIERAAGTRGRPYIDLFDRAIELLEGGLPV